jgi:tetratricopeptide (TPR) repeat protein
MMRKVSILFFTLVAAAAQAQNQTQKPVQKPGQPVTPQNQTPPEVDRLTEHFVRKNSLANRWNDADVARDALYDLIAEYPGNDSLIYALALDYYNNQKYISSVLVAQDLLTRNPKNVDVLQIAASGFEALNLSDKALANYETLYLQNNNSGALYKMAVLQYELKKYVESKTNVDILLTKPDIETMRVTLRDAENKQKEYPFKVSLLNLKGLLAQQAGDKAGAKKAFEESLALAPDFPLAKQNLAKLK